MKKSIVILVGLALGLGACGGSDTGGEVVAEVPEGEGGTRWPTNRCNESNIVPPGYLVIAYNSRGGTESDLVLEDENGTEIGRTEPDPDSDNLTVLLDAGVYRISCDPPEPRFISADLPEEGCLLVEEGATVGASDERYRYSEETGHKALDC